MNFSRYFTFPGPLGGVADMEGVIYGEAGRLVMAHNGWVMNSDPLQDFADKEHDGRVYFRRELIAWGDSVKLRWASRYARVYYITRHL